MKRIVLAVAFVALAACGGGGGGAASAGDVEHFRTTAQAVSSAVAAYGSAAATMPDHTACSADESAYEAQVRPMLSDLEKHGAAMDERMSEMGQGMDADMSCGTSAMTAELDAHASVACASASDMAPNEGEAARHVHAMSAWAEHQRIRAEQAGSMMGMGGMSGGTTGTCQRNADGSYSLVGGMMP